MRFAQYFVLVGAMALMMSAGAFAKDSNSGNFTLGEKMQIGTVTLAPGHYKAEWSGPANDVKVMIMHNNKTITTADGTLKLMQQPAPYTAVITNTSPNNTKQINEIEFDHSSEALVFSGAMAQ